MAWQKSSGRELKCSQWYFYMEKRKWDVNSISVIQFSCEIKRKARIWEIWKLQLQDKWYLKGSCLMWLNLSSNVITEMHYLQGFYAPQAVFIAHIKPVQQGWADGGVTGWKGVPRKAGVLHKGTVHVQPLQPAPWVGEWLVPLCSWLPWFWMRWWHPPLVVPATCICC